jgi:hypothetical protein
MKTYIVVTTSCEGQVHNVYVEKDIWKVAQYAVQECVNYAQLTQLESIEIVAKLNAQEYYLINKVDVNTGPDFFITVWQK